MNEEARYTEREKELLKLSEDLFKHRLRIDELGRERRKLGEKYALIRDRSINSPLKVSNNPTFKGTNFMSPK